MAETKCLRAPGKFIKNQECQRNISKIISYLRKLDFTSLVVSFRVARLQELLCNTAPSEIIILTS